MNALAEYVAGCKGRRVFQHLRSVNAVLHCTLVHNGTVRRCIRVGATSPKCATDQYALGLCRAYAGVILTTARILRAEPTMTTSYDPGWYGAIGRILHPRTVILSRSGNIPWGHPAFISAPGPVTVLYRGTDPLYSIPREMTDRGVQLVRETSDLQSIIRRWKAPVCLEAGPSTTNELYQARAVDALLLSTYNGTIDPELLGLESVQQRDLDTDFDRVFHASEQDGQWTFELFIKKRIRHAIADLLINSTT